ncbi:amidohydrolase family protein [Gloeobacter morelensis]|uniref:Amidohydrolase family protein n=1 Tax=Gloeobacter morelensis MG652769 TaxID=2781736 RepID=A0ABY3PI71_9CYAN|nr:amidohydrolase family protein [Gloeobacter morelensis]UFP93319.1 amidohydrolase family protein [Gloeobacter morelensis MG652769]
MDKAVSDRVVLHWGKRLLGPLLGLVLASGPVASQSPDQNYAFVGGQWFNGRGFEKKMVYAVGGRFTFERPSKIDSTVDLQNRYVVPPFGEAHTHRLSDRREVEAGISDFLRDGIYYAKILNDIPLSSAVARERLNRPDSVDAVYAHGGLTATGGHPIRLYAFLAQSKYIEITDFKKLDGQAYHVVDSEADLERKWPQILAGKPDLIKTYLLYSEEFDKRKDDKRYFGAKGLDPRLLGRIVAKAHRAGLRVATHIETAADFRSAVAAGVDEIAHLPGYWFGPPEWPMPPTAFELTREDVQLARRNNVVVVTTTLVTDGLVKDKAQAAQIQAVQKRNLRLLKEAGVQLVIGSDAFGATSLQEALKLDTLGGFDRLELLKHLCESTPQNVFPDRKIGSLAEGYEASFLVLEADPLADFGNIKKIARRFKQGRWVEVPAAGGEKRSQAGPVHAH